MTILAIDAASVSCSACVEKDGKVLAEAFINTALTHSVTLLISSPDGLVSESIELSL